MSTKGVCILGLTSFLLTTAHAAAGQQLVPARDASLLPVADTVVTSPDKTTPSPMPGPSAPFRSLGHDFKHLFTLDSVRTVAPFIVAAVGVTRWDRESVEEAQEHLPRSVFRAGNIGGGFFVQTGMAAAVWAVAHATGRPGAARLGGDLLRAQIVSQGVVQAVKMATQRSRPDDSNDQAFPSGHTASAFATATVLRSHFGWKAGIPAYAFGGYVAAARMSANKHHLSDVLMGAAVGIAAARTVTVGPARHRFALGVAPTAGGAAVMFTRK